jgi:hypothetical protein
VIVLPRRYVLFHPGSELKAALQKQAPGQEKAGPGPDLKSSRTYP